MTDHRFKIDPSDYPAIIALYSTMTIRKIAKRYKVSHGTINRIVNPAVAMKANLARRKT